jgi:hypothetical protein
VARKPWSVSALRRSWDGHRRGGHRADRELLFADLKLVARPQRLAAVDALAVDEDAIGAAKVFDHARSSVTISCGVFSRHQAVVEYEVAIGTSPMQHSPGRSSKVRPGTRARSVCALRTDS